MTLQKELLGPRTSSDGMPFLRKDVEPILFSDERLPFVMHNETLPVAGLRSFVNHSEDGRQTTVFPREVLNPQYRPVVIVDLDESCWPHAANLVHAISHVVSISATEQDLWTYGHTRKIPQWMTPEIDTVQDMIQLGKHPDVFPFMNKAHSGVVPGLHAIERMGLKYAYLTARVSELFPATKRILAWNNMPHDETAVSTDARLHSEPRQGHLYCAHADPGEVNTYKRESVTYWLSQLRQAGWKGKMIIIDDTPRAYKEEVESGEVIALALVGPLNQHVLPCQNEIRARDWYQISEHVKHFHGQALIQDPSPVRVFDCSPQMPDTQLVVRKDVSGPGFFRLETLPRDSYVFFPSPVRQEE